MMLNNILSKTNKIRDFRWYCHRIPFFHCNRDGIQVLIEVWKLVINMISVSDTG